MGFKIKKIRIKNFRNFEDIEFITSKKNIIIGYNDVGKTNLLYALRIVFDKNIRGKELLKSDFHKKNTEENFEIVVECDISDINCIFTEIILSVIKELRKKKETTFFIKAIGDFSEGLTIKWSVDGVNYQDIPMVSVNKSQLDNIFELYYIPPYNDIEKKFKNFKEKVLKKNKIESDDKILEIMKLKDEIKEKVDMLPKVKDIQNKMDISLEEFEVSYKSKIASNIGLNGVYDDLELYTVSEEDEIYPATGDGRKKTLLYSMYLYEINEESKKIPIILMEEPENHLFITNQISLSKIIFEKTTFVNLFLTTHSPQLMYHLTKDTNVVRISKKESKSISKSSIVTLPESFDILKNKFQKDIADALFYKTIFLVEGYSEKIIFDYILEKKISSQEKRNDIYILNIIGVSFKIYYAFFKALGIDVRVKTDNDIVNVENKKTSETEIRLLGYNRLRNLLNEKNYENIAGEIASKNKANAKEKIDRVKLMEKIYDTIYVPDRLKYENEFLYLSKVDLENDLAEVLVGNENREEFVTFLQDSKWFNLYEEKYKELIFSDESIEKIISSEYFKCLKDLIER